MDELAREQAFMSALVTEHFVLGSTRAATITEANGRGAIYLSVVSSGLVAFGFLAQGSRRLEPFVAVVLPAVLIIGIFTFIRVMQTSIENAVLTLQIQRIRGYYRNLVPAAKEFFDPPGSDDALAVAMATTGNRASPAQLLFTMASMIAAVNSILGGAGSALLASNVASVSRGSEMVVGIILGMIFFALHLIYAYQRGAGIAGWVPLGIHRRPPGPIEKAP